MDEVDWKIVVELHKSPSITRTADRLCMTQPALSKRLQLIERELGVRLVMRTSRGVVFTPTGEYVAAEAVKTLGHFDEIKRNIVRLGDGRSGVIRLGATNSFARFTLPRALRHYKQVYPDVEFDISTGVSASIIDLLDGYRSHVGFIRGETQRDFDRVLIGTEQACLVSRTTIDLADLPRLPQIAYLTDPFAIKLVEQWWNSRFSAPPLIGMRANHGETCHEMIANGLGYGIFLSPDFISPTDDLFHLPLTYPDGSPLARNSWMVWRREFAEWPLVRNFLAYMQSQLVVGLRPATP
ncbi:MAG: LysR family transcriptional regulator [Rhodoplanes sp.]|uniref:LysR family transcriptional regulator n=1 Tax=Rhodoplanes sp. TaxID=1968906 RepID=UPI0018099ADC|nr:LysR family transcriptional regulator [Rhodoplanes sp.]NVO15312.1 LysR family transcriptional regulator [Rhodoplanes sp.]